MPRAHNRVTVTVLVVVVTVVAPLLACAVTASGATMNVTADADLRDALRRARPGDHVRLAAGAYRAGIHLDKLAGTPQQPIVIEAADPKDPPAFEGGVQAIHLTDAAHVTLRHLVIRGQTGNGINVDDGGSYDTPAHHVTIEHVVFRDIGPRGNHDALKLSGVDDFVIRDCTFEGWAGQAIDLVGCHRGRIEACVFRARDGFDSTTGPQAKGGSSDIVIAKCRFSGPIQRGVNIGGSTGAPYFRPKPPETGAYEAKDVTVESCDFRDGVIAPIAFVGVDGAVARGNTIHLPGKFVFRILQETTGRAFVPCRNGRIEKNVIVFRRGDVREVINIGPNTDAKSFRFTGNQWYCADEPARSKPNLPSPETNGIYGVKPKLAP
jgi:hypothetical protein